MNDAFLYWLLFFNGWTFNWKVHKAVNGTRKGIWMGNWEILIFAGTYD